MKIRFGLVSNSSSSSFIVAFPRKPTGVDDIAELLFSKQTPGGYDKYRVAATVFSDMEKPASKNKIIDNLASGYYIDMDDWKRLHPYPNKTKAATPEAIRQYFEDWNKEKRKRARKAANEFIKANPDSVFYVFNYSDNDGDYYCDLEHDGTFDAVPNIRISHH